MTASLKGLSAARLGGIALLAWLAVAGTAFAAKPFTLFETGQARPLALAPDGARLFAINTPDNRLEIFDVAVGGLSHVGSVAVGLEPIAVAARTNDEVWVVNHLSDSVSIVDVTVPAAARVVRTLLVGDEPRDIVFGGASGERAFITTAHRGQNTPFHATIETILTTPGLGRADVWVFDAGNLGSALGGTPLTILTLFGDTPRALAVTPDGSTVYAAVFHSGNRTTAISEGAVCDGGEGVGPCTVCAGGSAAGAECVSDAQCPGSTCTLVRPGGLPEPNTNWQAIAGPEVGLVVQYDGGAWRDELGRDWSNEVRFDLPDEDVFVIDALATPPVQTGVRAGVGTILFNMVVNPANQKVYVSNLESFNRVRFEGPGIFAAGFKPPGEPATVRGHLAESRITVLDGASVLPRHLNKHIDYTTCCAPIPNAENDTSLGFPLGMAVSSDGGTLYVAGFGSSEIGVYTTSELEDDTFVPAAADQIPVSGGGPTGVVLDEGRTQLYVLTRFDNAVKVLSTATGAELAAVPLHNPEPASVVEGRPFLYDTAVTSSHGDSACASCHIFGDFDSLAWDLGDPDGEMINNPGPFAVGPFIDPDFHPMKGPMTTQSLRGMANHGAMHWRGDRTGGNDVNPPGGVQPDTGAFDEQVAFKLFNPAFEGLVGRSEQLTADEMQKFTDFILEVMYPPSPIRNLDNTLTPSQQAGRNFYFGPISDSLQTCNGCHRLAPNANESFGVAKPGFFGTDGRYSFEAESQIFKIPHLRNMYQKVGMFGMPLVAFFNPGDHSHQGDQVRGFGFLHDGSTDTLFRFHNATVFNASGINPNGIPAGAPGDPLRRQIEAFMMAFDTNLAPIVGQQITRRTGGGAAVDGRITLLIARANAGECDVVVKGTVGGEDRGWVYVGGGLFESDRAAEGAIADAALRALANSAGQELTYTAVPPGSGVRIGVDRDEDGFRDRDELDQGSDPADFYSVPAGACAGDPSCVKCRRTIAKEASKFAQERSKRLLKCELSKVKGTLPPATDCGADGGTAAKIAKAASKMRAKIGKQCGGADKVCNGDASEPITPVIGWGPSCPAFESGACSRPIAHCGDIASCLECIHDEATDQANELWFDAMSLPSANAEVNKCQQAIGREAQKFLASKSKLLQKCWDRRILGRHGDTCPDAGAPIGSAARKTADQIAKAESKKVAKICKACGGADQSCSGAGDLSLAAIGFVASCPDVTPPGGASCDGAITTLQDLVDCVDCVTEFKVDCMDRAQVPQFGAYPTECTD
jgi:DNA-binding beta-propeller fold protein YncE